MKLVVQFMATDGTGSGVGERGAVGDLEIAFTSDAPIGQQIDDAIMRAARIMRDTLHATLVQKRASFDTDAPLMVVP